MFHIFRSLKDFIFGEDSIDDDVYGCAVRLKQEIEIEKQVEKRDPPVESPESSYNCIQATGKIRLSSGGDGWLDGIGFSMEVRRPLGTRDGDIVEYLKYRKDAEHPWQVVKILKVVPSFTNDDIVSAEKIYFQVGTQMQMGVVTRRLGRQVFLEALNLTFSLDSVASNFIPEVGDLIDLKVQVQETEDFIFNDPGEILAVEEIHSHRSTVREGIVTNWQKDMGVGVIDSDIFFTKAACEPGYNPTINDKIAVDALESEQGKYPWRAITVSLMKTAKIQEAAISETECLIDNNNQKQIYISKDLSFGKLMLGCAKELVVEIHNRDVKKHTLRKGVFLGRRKDSQMQIISKINTMIIAPGQKLELKFACTPSWLGYSEELFSFIFESFNIKRRFKIYVVDDENWLKLPTEPQGKRIFSSERSKTNLEIHQNQMNMEFVRGIKLKKQPNFIAVRFPEYNIPTNVWETVRKYYNEDHKPLLLEEAFPILSENLTMENYELKFHTMLYLEEIDYIIRIRDYDLDRSFMTRSGEFLCLEVPGLPDKRPSILPGDSIKVCRLQREVTLYEGVVHQISGCKIFAKFSPRFQNSYYGEDLKIAFTISRTNFVKSHHAIHLVAKNLQSEVLFPNTKSLKSPMIEIVEETDVDIGQSLNYKQKKIQWYNTSLNSIQKSAVRAILQGVARPLPFIIFGPPGTGKTMTLVEAIKQIVQLIPESRVLVATPSNSAANVITERLLDTNLFTTVKLVRVMAQHVAMQGLIPDAIKPYCATVDTALETANPLNTSYQMRDDGIQMNCKKSFIGKHRVTIGTCSTIGNLIKLGLAEGHFTHVVVDEAGQATEPDLMIALSFMSKSSGQAVLAGDPKQLGPIILSTAAASSGLEESFLERLLNCGPYKKDLQTYKADLGGYDPRLVALLVLNYRSIPKLLKLPSDMFYDSCLRSTLSLEDAWVKEVVVRASEVFELQSEPDFPGLVFCGVRGVNKQVENSLSWYNPHEATMVIKYVKKLYRQDFTQDDIGIICPYIEQIKFLRTLFEDLETECPKIGTVEEFQGQERKIVLMSTVRSMEDVESSKTYLIGFLRNPKRLNVSLTRAQVMLVIFGNPHLLSCDPNWFEVIKYAVEHGHYMGCNLPAKIESLKMKQMTKKKDIVKGNSIEESL